MTARSGVARLRTATSGDAGQLLGLWDLLLDQEDAGAPQPWREHARSWVERAVDDPDVAHLPVVEVDGGLVAAAVGTLELGVPNPWCPRGRTVRLANVVTLPVHRGRGYASRLVREVVAWARTVEADRVDLSATAAGRRIYERAGFSLTSAPRMKLVLTAQSSSWSDEHRRAGTPAGLDPSVVTGTCRSPCAPA